MWQSSKAHPLAYCPPDRGIVVCHINRGRCPRLLKVVPSRHQSACGVLMAHVSSIGNIRDLIPFRLPTGQTRQVGRFRQASSLAWMNITTWLHGRKPGERKQVPSVQSV